MDTRPIVILRPFCLDTIHFDANIEHGAIHIWTMQLDVEDGQLYRLKNVISNDEIRRAERFRMEIDRRRYIAKKGMHRLILSRYHDIDAEKLTFRYTLKGKPFIPSFCAKKPIFFSMSSSGSFGVLST